MRVPTGIAAPVVRFYPLRVATLNAIQRGEIDLDRVYPNWSRNLAQCHVDKRTGKEHPRPVHLIAAPGGWFCRECCGGVPHERDFRKELMLSPAMVEACEREYSTQQGNNNNPTEDWRMSTNSDGLAVLTVKSKVGDYWYVITDCGHWWTASCNEMEICGGQLIQCVQECIKFERELRSSDARRRRFEQLLFSGRCDVI